MAEQKITIKNGKLNVPDKPVIPYIEGDGTGPDIWAASQKVFDAAVEKAYGGSRKLMWKEVLAGEKAFKQVNNWLPNDTLEAFREYLVGIKGPLTTPVGGGIRSLNVALRQELDLYACVRPVRWFEGVPSPVKHPELTDMVIFRENTEDIYAGIEYMNGTPQAQKMLEFLQDEMGVKKIRFPDTSSFGIKPVSKEGTERLVRAAIKYALQHKLPSVTLVHKGNIMKFTEGAFKTWGYELAEREFGDKVFTWAQYDKIMAKQDQETADALQKQALDSGKLLIKDSIADAFLQQILLRPAEYSVVATLNLNGDYISDALAAIVGWHRHRARRQHQLRDRPRHLRGHPRHGAQVCQPGQGEPRLGDSERRPDAGAPGLAGSRRPHLQGPGSRHRRQARHLRLRAPDGRRYPAEMLGVWG